MNKQITTAEDLDALPDGSRFLDAEGYLGVVDMNGADMYLESGREWRAFSEIYLPATLVIWKARTITTAEELDALPARSVVQLNGDGYPVIAVKSIQTSSDGRSIWDTADVGDSEYFTNELLPWATLPATVLWEPTP